MAHLEYSYEVCMPPSPPPPKEVKKPESNICELCGQKFRWQRALEVHVQGVHEKLNRYSCGICGAKYRNRLNVRRHLVSHFSIPQYKCTVCLVDFMVASTCSKHIKKAHEGRGSVTV